MQYGDLYHITNRDSFHITEETEVLLVTGIANPLPLKKLLHDTAATYYQMAYNDHHIFTIDDLNDIRKRFDTIQAPQKIILTTEKDAVRLIKFEQELKDLPLYVLPIEPAFLFGDAGRFDNLVRDFIRNFKQSS